MSISKSVSEVVLSIKDLIEGEFRNVVIEGELSNLTSSGAGHWYFTLSDADSSLSAACFKFDAIKNPLLRSLKDGEQVICQGDISVYPKRGTFQIVVKRITKVGIGNLKEQFEKLKKKLTEQGVFDLSHKKLIPEFPKRVAVITALQAAALADFLNVYSRRSAQMNILIVPSIMQGNTAPRSVINALDRIEKLEGIDVIVITRGGGSLEDLWAFNDENLVKRIYNCKIPIISAIGHEVDYTLCDYVSDKRCETPTAAAEVLTQKYCLLNNEIDLYGHRLEKTINSKLQNFKYILSKNNPQRLASILTLATARLADRIERINLSSNAYRYLRVDEINLRLDESINMIHKIIEEMILVSNNKLDTMKRVIDSINPKNVLNRGYSYIMFDNDVISDTNQFDQLKKGALLDIQLSDGKRRVEKK